MRKGAGLSGAAKEDKEGRLFGARVMLWEEKSQPTFSTFGIYTFHPPYKLIFLEMPKQ